MTYLSGLHAMIPDTSTEMRLFLPLVAALGLILCACNPQEMALLGSEDTNEVTAFDPGSGTVQGTVTIPNVSEGASEILLRQDGQIGYVRGEVTQGQTTIRVVDIESPPTLEGTPTTVSYIATDLAEVNALTIVGAGRDALGSGDILVSSAVPAAQSEEDVLNLGPGSDATVDVCDDESTVLVATNGTGSQRAVQKLKIDDQQRLTDTGNSFQKSAPLETFIVPRRARPGSLLMPSRRPRRSPRQT